MPINFKKKKKKTSIFLDRIIDKDLSNFLVLNRIMEDSSPE